MSVYATMVGELKFNSREKLDKAKAILEDGGWIKDGIWQDEAGGELAPYVKESLRIEIPMSCYRNLLHVIDDIVALSNYHDIVWASTDGMFDGGIISSGGDKTVKLDQWAQENGMNRPEKTEDEDGYDSDDLIAWREEVVQEFVSNPGDI